MPIALTRDVSPALARCELTFQPRVPIDYARAAEQHQAYLTLLRSLGLTVQRLAADPELPDCCFVEDAAVVLDEVAVVTRMGAASRRGESAAVAAALAPHRPLRFMAAPACLDGGDVLRVGRRLFVGLSSRTNAAGLATLREVAAPLGYEVLPVAVTGSLHLKSAMTALGDGAVLANPRWCDLGPVAGIEVVPVAEEEPHAANVLTIGTTLVAAAGFPRTVQRLRGRGWNVQEIEVSEFLKAEAGVTCKAIVFEASASTTTCSITSSV
ncbi:MAG TPA: arginine deiminase-related protein [Vicinamibacteria bacterium]|nr:arginine deiminase-related protein [Vicinamibacteria bacterium]